jgi:hypothetical protein
LSVLRSMSGQSKKKRDLSAMFQTRRHIDVENCVDWRQTISTKERDPTPSSIFSEDQKRQRAKDNSRTELINY